MYDTNEVFSYSCVYIGWFWMQCVVILLLIRVVVFLLKKLLKAVPENNTTY